MECAWTVRETSIVQDKDIWIWNADGRLVDKIACPERAVNCAFGGPNLQELYLAGFGGVHTQKMKVAGVPAQPPVKWPDSLAGKCPVSKFLRV